MTCAVSGQLILGTDKHNPLFTVYAGEDEEELHVYYGLELLEVVSADRNDPSFKMLIGRLYNARLSPKVLEQTFGVDRKTIQRWGQALRGRDAEELLRVLAGRRGRRKLTGEIEAYVRLRWPELSQRGTYGIGKRLRQEIQSVFKRKISQETLRPLIGELKRAGTSAEFPAPAPQTPTTAGSLPGLDQPMPGNQEFSDGAMETACDCGSEEPPEQSGLLPTEESAEQTHFCDHAGVLMFAPILLEVARAVDPPQPVFAQWLASLLLGALNIEQSKFLNWEDMSRLLGSVVRFPHPQREQLQRVALEENFAALARFNGKLIEARAQRDFYFDPHTKHYTGERNVLEGWCPAIRWADKAMHSDFVHTAAGQPLYFETTDNFADLRERFFAVVERCRNVLGFAPDQVLSWVVDRGIFGKEVFENVLANPLLHLVTWEKGFQAQSWPPSGGISGSMVIERARNRAQDLRCYHLEYCDQLWPKDPRLRQIVVQATNPKAVTIQVSILSDDLQRAAPEIIRLIFCRWLQENDFKYLDKHFGINQITSYQALNYEELRQSVEDRQVRSAEFKALQEQASRLRSRQARLLLLQAKNDHQGAQRQTRIQELEAVPASDRDKRQLARLRQQQTRWQNTRQERQKEIDRLSRELAELEEKSTAVHKTESRLERLIQEQMVRMEPSNKRLMDSLRVIARNAFYEVLAPFKKAYNNYRDDHDQFRRLTQAGGVLEMSGDEIRVHLLPRMTYSPKLRRIIADLLQELNAKPMELPDGSGRRLAFRLASRTEIQMTIKPSQ